MPTKYWSASFYTKAQKAAYQQECEEQHLLSKQARSLQSVNATVRSLRALLKMPELQNLAVRFSWVLWDRNEMYLRRRVISDEQQPPVYSDAHDVRGMLFLGSDGLWCAYRAIFGTESYEKVGEPQVAEVVRRFRITAEELREIKGLIVGPAHVPGSSRARYVGLVQQEIAANSPDFGPRR